MLIAFRSKADADVLMLWGHAQEVLTALGREPASEGIFLPEQIAAALSALALTSASVAEDASPQTDEAPPECVSLVRRAWPLKSLLERALQQGVCVTWGPL